MQRLTQLFAPKMREYRMQSDFSFAYQKGEHMNGTIKCLLAGAALLAAVLPAGLAGLANNGPHGFSEMLYAFTSATGNNGSAFAGLAGYRLARSLFLRR
mgnify:CR=1 FL=1